MTSGMKTIEVKLSRVIAAPAPEVFDRWLDPRCPGTPWGDAVKAILDARVDGLFYFLYVNEAGMERPHYGRFTVVNRPSRAQYTWMSETTRGLESLVTVTFENQGKQTLLTLRHENLPEDEPGRNHQKGWEHFLGRFADRFASRS